MEIKRAREFVQKHQDQFIDLFVTYQMIEAMLFLKLHLPGISETEDREDYLKAVNKQINSKTFGKLREVYLKKHPSDEYQILSGVDIVAQQRNSFMHSFCMVLALWENEREMNSLGKLLLDDFTKQAHSLFDKVMRMPG